MVNWKNILTKLYGNMYDMNWDEGEKKYIKKNYEFLKPSTKFFMTLINGVQVITRLIAVFYEKNMNVCVHILVCVLSIIFLHFKLEKRFRKVNENVNATLIREGISFLLFCIGLVLIIL